MLFSHYPLNYGLPTDSQRGQTYPPELEKRGGGPPSPKTSAGWRVGLVGLVGRVGRVGHNYPGVFHRFPGATPYTL